MTQDISRLVESLLTPTQVANIKSVSTETVIYNAKTGKLPFVWAGRTRLFDREDVEKWAQERAMKGSNE